VATHYGTIEDGHYTAYCKKEDNNWYLANDEKVTLVSKEEVL
jgi:ubiquitin C-terminal hydrolase